jgi:hypothetical protein
VTRTAKATRARTRTRTRRIGKEKALGTAQHLGRQCNPLVKVKSTP